MIEKEGLFTSVEMTKSERNLHTPGNFAKQNLLYVQEVGHLQSLKPHKCIRERLESFLILVVLEGKGNLEIAGKSCDVQAGDCAWIDCMEHYEHICDEDAAWKLAWVHFYGHTARGYYELFRKYNENNSVFHVENVDEWFGMIQGIMNAQKEKNILGELHSGEQITHLLNCALECVISATEMESQQEKQLAGEMREFINENYVAKNVMELISNQFENSVASLGDIFSGAYGITLEEYISNRRYNAAKELLRFSVKSVEEVAEESGIGDVIIMEQLFRSNEGMTAEEYRRKWAGWVRN